MHLLHGVKGGCEACKCRVRPRPPPTPPRAQGVSRDQ